MTQVALVTGANKGIGYYICLELARHNATVFCACRNKEQGEAAVASLREKSKSDKLHYIHLDLSDFKIIKQCSEEFLAKDLPLHILVNNAGAFDSPWQVTSSKLESHIHVNHLGPHYLTMLLQEKIIASAPARVVFTSSMAHKKVPELGLDFPGFTASSCPDESPNGSLLRYGQSKLANILCAKAWSDRLSKHGVFVNAVDPGIVATGLLNKANLGWSVRLGVRVMTMFGGVGPEKGALASLYAATKAEENGGYLKSTGAAEEPSEWARDEQLKQRLWLWSEDVLRDFI